MVDKVEQMLIFVVLVLAVADLWKMYRQGQGWQKMIRSALIVLICFITLVYSWQSLMSPVLAITVKFVILVYFTLTLIKYR